MLVGLGVMVEAGIRDGVVTWPSLIPKFVKK
jgi:hypothetical protein